MNRTRRGGGAGISFFAFQDIITAVSGILIVIVLLLTLELVDRPQSESAAAAGAGDATAAAVAAETERDALKAALADEASAVRAAAGTSAGEMSGEIEGLRQEVERVAAEDAALDAQAERLREAAAAAEVRRFDAADAFAGKEKAEARAAELEAEVAAAQRDDRLVFTLPRGVNKDGWLAVVAGGSVEVAPLGRPERPTTFRGGSSEAAAKAFLDWSAGRRRDYFLLLIRPDGTDGFDMIDEAFTQQGVAYGFDVVGRDRAVLHPERGAAP